MAYTEKVSISGTALSFLLYECTNSASSQEGFLIGDVSSEITNHISDSQSDGARLDIQISVRSVLPLPSVALFYSPTGRINEDVLKELLPNRAGEIIGWYKFRRNNSMKPTFRDKSVSKSLQKVFEKNYNCKTFVTCLLTNRISVSGSTHTLTYRFGKINSLDMYEYIEDVTANLGEKLTGYKKPHRTSPHNVFNKIIKESNVQGNNATDAILHIQEAVDMRLAVEARIAAKTELTIREIEAEINNMLTILAEKHTADLQEVYDKIIYEKMSQTNLEIIEQYAKAIKSVSENVVPTPNFFDTLSGSGDRQDMEACPNRVSSPVLTNKSTNYAAALKKNNSNAVPSTSRAENDTEDLIAFDEPSTSRTMNNKRYTNRDKSPEY